ncbi:MAG: 50S ribosomal protein L21 [Candidatus Gracilibacteria bacterium]|jgi:large subunit ribosomal protein L21|nr:50S ribosomal protein L21 [Candidatus Gracilibacteria bacterium]
MFAVIETGGKQYRVEKGDKIQIEKLNEKVGAKVKFDNVLLVADDKDVEVGKPTVEKVTVSAKVLEQGKADKITVFKFKSKKRYQKKQGHRQQYTEIEITDIKKAA